MLGLTQKFTQWILKYVETDTFRDEESHQSLIGINLVETLS